MQARNYRNSRSMTSARKSPTKPKRKGTVAGAVKILKAKAENRRGNRASYAAAQKLSKKVSQKSTTPAYKKVISTAKSNVKKPEVQSTLKKMKTIKHLKSMSKAMGRKTIKLGTTSKGIKRGQSLKK